MAEWMDGSMVAWLGSWVGGSEGGMNAWQGGAQGKGIGYRHNEVGLRLARRAAMLPLFGAMRLFPHHFTRPRLGAQGDAWAWRDGSHGLLLGILGHKALR